MRAPVGKPRCPPAISRLRVEKVEGGLAVAGVVVAANCQIVLPIFGFLFMLVGCVLTGKCLLSTIAALSLRLKYPTISTSTLTLELWW